MCLRRGRRAGRENSLPTVVGPRSAVRRRHPADERCAARGRGICPPPGAPSAPAALRDARQPTSDCIAATYSPPAIPSHCFGHCQRSDNFHSADRDCFVAALLAMTALSHCIALHQCARGGAVFEAFAAAGAFHFLDLVEMPRLEQSRAYRHFRANFAAEAAGTADRVVDLHFHWMPPTWCNR